MLTFLVNSPSHRAVCRRLVDAMRIDADTSKDAPSSGLVIRWGAWREEIPEGVTELNTTDAVLASRNKITMRRRLGALAPPTVTRVKAIQSYPCVIRPKRHFGGRGFHVCTSRDEAKKVAGLYPNGWYASPLIRRKQELRVFVLSGFVVAVSTRTGEAQDKPWNLAQTGQIRNLPKTEWSPTVLAVAIEAASRLNLDFAAVDLAIDDANRAWVLETNTAPGLKNPWTIKQVAKALAWTAKNGVPKKEVDETWLHPALRR